MNEEALQISSLIELYKQEYGVSLSIEEASEELQRLKTIYTVVYNQAHESFPMV